jgi:hypothetical protein
VTTRDGTAAERTGRAGLEPLRAAWVEALDAELDAAVALRRRLHAAPEVSGQ